MFIHCGLCGSSVAFSGLHGHSWVTVTEVCGSRKPKAGTTWPFPENTLLSPTQTTALQLGGQQRHAEGCGEPCSGSRTELCSHSLGKVSKLVHLEAWAGGAKGYPWALALNSQLTLSSSCRTAVWLWSLPPAGLLTGERLPRNHTRACTRTAHGTPTCTHMHVHTCTHASPVMSEPKGGKQILLDRGGRPLV